MNDQGFFGVVSGTRRKHLCILPLVPIENPEYKTISKNISWQPAKHVLENQVFCLKKKKSFSHKMLTSFHLFWKRFGLYRKTLTIASSSISQLNSKKMSCWHIPLLFHGGGVTQEKERCMSSPTLIFPLNLIKIHSWRYPISLWLIHGKGCFFLFYAKVSYGLAVVLGGNYWSKNSVIDRSTLGFVESATEA